MQLHKWKSSMSRIYSFASILADRFHYRIRTLTLLMRLTISCVSMPVCLNLHVGRFTTRHTPAIRVRSASVSTRWCTSFMKKPENPGYMCDPDGHSNEWWLQFADDTVVISNSFRQFRDAQTLINIFTALYQWGTNGHVLHIYGESEIYIYAQFELHWCSYSSTLNRFHQ